MQHHECFCLRPSPTGYLWRSKPQKELRTISHLGSFRILTAVLKGINPNWTLIKAGCLIWGKVERFCR